MSEVDTDAIGKLLLDMEVRAHRAGWDGWPVFALLSGDQRTDLAYMRAGGVCEGRHGDYTAWSVLPPTALLGYPQHGLFRFALNLVHGTGELHDKLLSMLRQPGFLGTAFLGEGWEGATLPEERGGRRLADVPGSKEIRFAHAADITGAYHAVYRQRGEKPRLMGGDWTPAGSVPDSLRAITAVIAGTEPPEHITEPSMWSWEDEG